MTKTNICYHPLKFKTINTITKNCFGLSFYLIFNCYLRHWIFTNALVSASSNTTRVSPLQEKHEIETNFRNKK